MAQLNFNALIPQGGPQNFYQGFEQGQKEQQANALALQKQAQEQEMNALRVQQLRGTIGEQESTRQKQARAEKVGAFRERLLRAPNPEAAREIVKMQYADPDLAPVLSQSGSLEQALAEVSDDPTQFERYKQQEAMGMSEWMKSQMPKVAGNAIYLPSEGRFITPPVAPKEATPPAMVAEYQFAQTPQGGGFRGSYQDFVVQREAAKRAPRPEAAPRTQQVTLSDGSLGIMNMDTAAVTPATMGGVAAKGKLSPFAEKTAAQKAQTGKDINQAIFELKNVAKEGGLIDQSTGSGAGKLIDITAGFGGKAMPGAIAAGQLAPIADLVLKMVPRFEGPQSDKDTQSYKAAAGQLADSSLPTKIRKAAANEIIRLMESRKNQFGEVDVNAAPAAPRIAPPAGFTPD